MKTAFGILLGAGASIDSGISKTQEITDFVLNSSAGFSGNQFHFGEGAFSNPLRDDCVPKVRIVLGYLKWVIDRYYTDSRSTNYEDLYYALDQLVSDEDGDFDNPIIRAFSEHLRNGIIGELKKGGFLLPAPDAWTGEEMLLDYGLRDPLHAIKYARLFIKDAVAFRIASDTLMSDLTPYKWIGDAINDCGPLPLFTLNHDVLLENYLSSEHLPFEDGFRSLGQDGASSWSPEILDQDGKASHLLKLHGSLNWHWASENESLAMSFIKVSDYDTAARKYDFGDGDRRMFLAGTHNKLAAYTVAPYAEMRYQFLRALKKIKRIVICGYSFGDKGINNSLIDWMATDSERKIFTIDPRASEVMDNARFAVSGKVRSWRNAGRLYEFNKPMKAMKWTDLFALERQ